MLEGIIQSKSKTFLAFCFCFLMGVATISIADKRFDFVYLYLSFFVLATFIIVFWKNRKLRFVSFGILFFILGVTRYIISFPPDYRGHVSYYNNQKQTIIGYVAAEPDIRSDGVRYIVSTYSLGDDEVKGNIYLKSGLYPRYEYGDVLKIACKFKAPEPIEAFRYDMYLARFRVFSICGNPRIEKIGDKDGNVVMRGILNIKNVVAEKINLLWHEPHASFMAGLLYGYRGGLGNLNELFNITGVTHIVAISGYNITIIATILITLFVHLLIPRKKAFWLVSIGIVLFVLFAGASASVVRAGIMGILVLLARQMGRLSRVGNVLILTAVIMTLHNPFILIWDAGFQLSFISTVGLVYVAPLIKPWFLKIPEALGLQESVVSTLSAIIATLPLILYQFGRLSIVAVIVNVLILWVIPLIMMLGFFAVFFSFIFLPVGQVISWIAWAGLEYIIIIVKFFARLPFAAVEMRIPVWLMIGMYIAMFFVILRKLKKHPSGYQ